MKINQIIVEVSKAEKVRQRKEVLAARKLASATTRASTVNQDKLRATLRQQKVAQQLKPIEVPKKEEPTGFLADPELAKYAVSDDDEQGVYLNFTTRKDPLSKEQNVWAYWSKSGIENIDLVEPYGQVERLGNSPLSQRLFTLIKRLIRDYGYVHVYINGKNLRSMPYEFKNLAEYLRSVYPEDTSNVAVEVNPRDSYPVSTPTQATATANTGSTKLSSATLKKYEPDLVRLFRSNPTLSQAFRNIPISQQVQVRNELLNIIAIYSPDVDDAIPEIKQRLAIS
jgi:hypothetical protein